MALRFSEAFLYRGSSRLWHHKPSTQADSMRPDDRLALALRHAALASIMGLRFVAVIQPRALQHSEGLLLDVVLE